MVNFFRFIWEHPEISGPIFAIGFAAGAIGMCFFAEAIVTTMDYWIRDTRWEKGW